VIREEKHYFVENNYYFMEYYFN